MFRRQRNRAGEACGGCGYDVSCVPDAKRCPECGYDIGWGRAHRVGWSDEPWRSDMVSGTKLLAWSLFLRPLMAVLIAGVVDYSRDINTASDIALRAAFIFGPLAAILGDLGALRIARQDIDSPFHRAGALARWARVSIGATLCWMVAVSVLPYEIAMISIWPLGVARLIAEIIVLWRFFLLSHPLSERVGDNKFKARRARRRRGARLVCVLPEVFVGFGLSWCITYWFLLRAGVAFSPTQVIQLFDADAAAGLGMNLLIMVWIVRVIMVGDWQYLLRRVKKREASA